MTFFRLCVGVAALDMIMASSAAAQDKPAQIVQDLTVPFGKGTAPVLHTRNQLHYGNKSAGFGTVALTPDCPIPWSVHSTFLHGGRQDDVQLVTVDNGKLRITLIPTRGMGILDVVYDATGKDEAKPSGRLGWRSPVEEVINPAFINLSARGGLGFLEGFNEFMCRCGMENIGQPGKDEIVTNTGAKAEVDLTLHGKIANIPARHVALVVDTKPPYRIRIRAELDERMMFGPQFVLLSEFSTEPGSMSFRIQDKIINKASQPQEFQMLYHTNIGKPLLDAGARFLAPVSRVIPVNPHSAKDGKNYGDIAGPTPGIIEQAYFFHPIAAADGTTLALLHNKAKDQGMSMHWSVKQLPYLTLWKNTAAVEDGYVVGIEPGTSFPNTRRVERKAGRVPKLEGGKNHIMAIDFAVHVGAAALQPVIDRIDALQKTQPAKIEDVP